MPELRKRLHSITSWPLHQERDRGYRYSPADYHARHQLCWASAPRPYQAYNVTNFDQADVFSSIVMTRRVPSRT